MFRLSLEESEIGDVGGHSDDIVLERTRALLLAAIRFDDVSHLPELLKALNQPLANVCEIYLTNTLEGCTNGGYNTIQALVDGQFLPKYSHSASIYGCSVASAMQMGHRELAMLLIRAGADVNTAMYLRPGLEDELTPLSL
jgi:hypothetical protein